MRMIQVKTEAERAAFAAKFAERTSNPLSKGFLQQADAYGFVSKGEMVGGFLVNERQPYRYVAMIPEKGRGAPSVRAHLSEGAALELACMWIDHGAVTEFQRARIYYSAIRVAAFSGRRFIIAGSVSENVASIHKLGFKRMVYRGPTTFDGAPHGEIYAARPVELLLWTPVATVWNLATRFRRRRKSNSGGGARRSGA